jgi:nitroreductase
MTALEAIRSRISANKFDPDRALAPQEIRELVEYAVEAPSSFNQQNWRFIAVTKKVDKERLKAVAYGQQKVADASVTFIILGDLKGVERLGKALEPSVKAGIITAKDSEGWVGMAAGMYADDRMARDEAVRSGSLAAMTLMIAAQAKGLVSGPMIGFDPEGVRREFKIPERYLPALLLPVGFAAPGNWPRKPRLPVQEVLRFDSGEGL